jgi:transcription elongation factor GreA
MADVTYFTKEGLERLKKELEELRTKGRAEVARALQEAREKGDLSENAEYDAAKEAQGHLELKIAKMEETLSNARLLDERAIDTSKVQILSTVLVKNHKLGKEQKFMLVSENETDVKSGKISVSSPIGSGLLGKKVGDKAEISTPSGVMVLEVLAITVE